MKLNKKGFSIGDMLPIGITIVVVSIALGLGGQILGTIQSSINGGNTTAAFLDDSVASNVSTYGLNSLTTMANYMPTIALVAIVSIIIGVVVVYLGRKM